MNSILVGTQLCYQVNYPTNFLLHFSVAQNPHQRVVNEQTLINQDSELGLCDSGDLGNRCYRLLAQPGELTLSYTAEVAVRPSVVDGYKIGESSYRNLPAAVLTYLNPSRYCEADRLGRFAHREFGGLAPGFSRVTAICDWVYDHLEYVAGSTDSSSTACDVLVQRAGVCRDFAHVGISMCRAVGIPARYISGYAVDLQPPDFHGFFEAYLDGQWYLFDPTKLAPVAGFVRIGTGRDAADVAFATLVGDAVLTAKYVWANRGMPSPTAIDEEVTEGSGVSTT